MFEDENRHYGLRKLSVGLASVLIGISFASSMNSSSVKADTVNGDSNDAQTVVKNSDTATKIDAKDDTNAIESNTEASKKDPNAITQDIKQKAMKASEAVTKMQAAAETIAKGNAPEAAAKNATDGGQATAESTLKGTNLIAKQQNNVVKDNANAGKDNSSEAAENDSLTAKNNALKATVEAAKQGLETPAVQHSDGNATALNVKDSKAIAENMLKEGKIEVKDSQAGADLTKNKLKMTTLMAITGKKLSANLLTESKVMSPANDANGGFDSSWGKLNVNDWQGSVQGDYYQLTDYTGDANHVIVPNEADFEKAGISTSGKQVGVTRDLMHTIFRDKTTAQDATVAFSKTNNKMVKAIDADWNNTWGHSYEFVDGSVACAKGKLTKFDGSNLDVSNVTNMGFMFNDNQISDLSSLTNWNTGKVTDMNLMFMSNQISNLSPLANWKVDNVTTMQDMFQDNQISDLSPLANWMTNKVTDMRQMFDGNQVSNLSPLANWSVDKVTNMNWMFSSNQISDLSPLANWKVDNVTTMGNMFDYNSSTQTKTTPAKRIITFVYPANYTGKKQDSVTQTVDVPTKQVKVELTTKFPKPSNNILDWVTKTETPLSTPIDPVYFQDYAVPEIKGLLEPDKTVISREQADITKPINVTVTYKLVDSNTNDAFALDPKNGLHEHANVNNNGGYDEDYWGKINIDDWNYTTNDNTITITGYKGTNPSSLIIPNGADFDLANGQGTGQSNVEISSSVMHDLAKNATRIGLSKTANKKVIASNAIWQDAFGGMTNGRSGDNSDGGIKILNPNLTQMDLHNLDTNNITDMSAMFNGGTNLKTIGDLSEWNTSKVTNMGIMFQSASNLTNIGNLDSWHTNNVSDMRFMFNNASSLTSLDLSNWDTSKVTDMRAMFQGASSLTTIGDLSKWDTSKVTDMSEMFCYVSSLTSLDLSNWDTSNVTKMDYMFQGASSLTTIGDLSKWNTSNVTKMNHMFEDASSLTSLDLSNWNTSKVTNMYSMFEHASSLTNLDVSKWNTSNVTGMSYMFEYASKLTNLDLSNWNTSKVTDMRNMFEHASNLTNLDLSNWDTSNVTRMDNMFSDASSLINLDVSKWNTSKVTNMRDMFSDVSSLTNLDVSKWNTSNVTDMSGMFSGTSSLTSLDLSNWNTSKVTNMFSMFTSLDPNRTSKLVLIIYNPNGWQAADIFTFYNYLENGNVPVVITTNSNILKAPNDSSYTIDGQTNPRSAIFDATKSPIAGKALPIYAKGMTNDQLEDYASAVIKLYNEKVMQDYQKAHPDKLISYAPTQDMTDPRKLATASFVTKPNVFNVTVHFKDIDPNADKDSDTVKQELAKTVELSGRNGDTVDLNQVQLPTNFELSGDLPSATFGATDSVTIKLKHKTETSIDSLSATRTINVHLPNNTIKVYQQIVGYQRDVITDLVTKTVARGKWNVNDVTSSFTIDGVKQLERSYVLKNGSYNYADIKLPKVPGYKAIIRTVTNPVNPARALFAVSFMALPKPVTPALNDVKTDKTVTPETFEATEAAELIKTEAKAATSASKVIDLSDDAVTTTPKENTWQVANEPDQDTYRVSNGKYTVELPHISNAQLHVIANDSTKDSVLFTYKGQNTKYVFNIKFVDGHYLLTTYKIKSGKLVKLIDYNFIKSSKVSDAILDWLQLK